MIDSEKDLEKMASLLWIDDQIGDFQSHIDDLQENGYYVTQASTADEALSTIRTGMRFDVILVDLKMADSDGIELLAELCSEVSDLKQTKIIVLSSFLYEPKVRRRLVDLNMNVALLEKTGKQVERHSATLAERVEEVLSQEGMAPPAKDQFSKWDRQASSSDPFEISLEAYLDSPMVVRLQLDNKAEAATSKARARLLNENVVWSLFCGSSDQPLKTASEASEIPSDDQIFSLASSLGHPPYEFYEEGEFEEFTGKESSPRVDQNGYGGCPGSPDYPFFKIGVVQHREHDISINLSRDFHFDSGLDITAFALETALEIGLEVENGRPAKFVKYDGIQHPFYPAKGDAYVERGNRGTLSVSINGRAYLDWDATPFNRLCRDFNCTAGARCFRRYALLGRNLLIENELQLDLRGIGA